MDTFQPHAEITEAPNANNYTNEELKDEKHTEGHDEAGVQVLEVALAEEV